ncbi:hypothetical protein D9M71_62630 [compost metagenome]
MSRARWKRVFPTSLRHALELCKDYALKVQNLSVERLAERMGMADHWTLYKWLNTGRMPAVMIPAYEAACGCQYVTRWLASASGGVLIDMPTGRRCTAQDMQALQAQLHTAVGALMAFYDGTADAPAALATVRQSLEGLAWHHGNVAQHQQPQLDLGNSDDH